jgi:DNA-binding NarL/FixJ family response regulator
MTQIVVIDDERDLLNSISTVLELAGYEVLQADNGIDGLRLIHDHLPALIVCDVTMPEISGYDVLEELQTNSTTVSIPVIFLTAQSEIHDIRRGMQAGVDDYLAKPFIEQDLLMAIRRRLEKRHNRELQQRMTFAHELVKTQEQQAQKIARVLDQNIRQKLINLKFWLETQIPSLATPNASLMQTMQHSLDDLLAQVTMLSYDLYPMMLSYLGLPAVLQWYFASVQQRLAVRVIFETYNMDIRLIDESELVFYRITQRVMERVIRAERDIRVVLWCDDNTVRFSISNLPEFEQEHQGHLLQLMEEYCHTINASVLIQAEDTTSSTIHVTLHNAVFRHPETALLPPVTSSVSTRNTILLVVSSEVAFLEHITQQLESSLHIIPYQATDTEMLLSQVTLHAPHILVLDVMVSSNLLSTLSSKTAVIVLSTYSNEAFARQTLHQGAMGFVLRAKAAAELPLAVQSVMQGVRYISASLVFESRSQSPTPKPLNLDALLTRREREIMELILQDLTHADIASKLVISPRTVEKHRANLMQKLALNTHTELILFALRHGLLSST